MLRRLSLPSPLIVVLFDKRHGLLFDAAPTGIIQRGRTFLYYTTVHGSIHAR